MKYKLLGFFLLICAFTSVNFAQENPRANPPIYIAFLWHMHQPIYWPYESIVQTQLNNRYPYSVFDIHNSRTGPYTNWPKDAVQKGISAGLGNLGTQVSFSGSLVENLNNLEAYGNNNFKNWKTSWNSIRGAQTVLGNPRMDLVGFGYYHPLMGLIPYSDIRRQIQMHKKIFADNFPGSYSKGIFPPENAFANRMIPALVDEGIEWVLVDNAHFDRAAIGYPFNTSGNLYEPNKADILNPDPNDWIALNNLWAPTKNSARWGRQPHYVEYTDASSGTKKRIIAVPADRYMGNEDGRGGFGALQYEAVMSQLESSNTDPNHPILIVLHHDGDNYGGGSEGYYGGNFQNFVNWLKANPTRFVGTTIQDYLEMYPPKADDVIHIESGSWSGADNGDPEFKKWLGDPDGTGYSPDRNSWAVMTAAQNYVHTAEQVNPSHANMTEAWKFFMVGQSSDYWYWDGSLGGIWDSNPVRAANQAITLTESIVSGGSDLTPPTIFVPQREPYNPGGTEWNQSMSSDFTVSTYVYDVSDLTSVTLFYRTDKDGVNNLKSSDNELYNGGSEVNAWKTLVMDSKNLPSQTTPAPLKKAPEFFAKIIGIKDSLVDYYVEAIDKKGNSAKSVIQHVYVGSNSGGGGGGSTSVSWLPVNPTINDSIIITVKNASQSMKLHWGVNNTGSTWITPNNVYWKPGTALFGSGPAVQTPFVKTDSVTYQLTIGPFNNPSQKVDRVAFVLNYADNSWDNNGGKDYQFTLSGGSGGGKTFVMDGAKDASAVSVSTNGGHSLYLDFSGSTLYVATESASKVGNDVFIFVTDSLRNPITAPWAKAGTVSGWSAYLANESTNNYKGWFDHQASTQASAGDILEGTIDMNSEFGYTPAKVYVAVGHYQTADQGALVKQIPAGSTTNSILGNTFYEYSFIVSNQNYISHVPSSFSVDQNYPNPFNPSTVISYAIPTTGRVTLSVYDVLGNKVSSLVDEEQTPGTYSLRFNGEGIASGIYFYSITHNTSVLTKKMQLIK